MTSSRISQNLRLFLLDKLLGLFRTVAEMTLGVEARVDERLEEF